MNKWEGWQNEKGEKKEKGEKVKTWHSESPSSTQESMLFSNQLWKGKKSFTEYDINIHTPDWSMIIPIIIISNNHLLDIGI